MAILAVRCLSPFSPKPDELKRVWWRDSVLVPIYSVGMDVCMYVCMYVLLTTMEED